MKRSTRVLVVMLAVFLFFIGGKTNSYSLEIGVRANYWLPDLKANIRVDQAGNAGTNIDIKDDLGIDDKNFPSIEAFAGLGKHHFSLMYTQVDYSGSKTISRAITFQGSTFPAGAQVESELKTRMLDLEYQYDLLNLENILAGFSLGVIGKLKYLDGEERMKSSTAGSTIDQKETFTAPIPMIGVGVHVGLLSNLLEAGAKVTGMGYSGNVFYDAMANLSLTPFPFMDIHGGYRIMKLKVDNVSDVYADMEFSGPYIGLTVGF